MSALKRGALLLMLLLVMLPASGTAAPADGDVTDEWMGDVEELPDTAAPVVERDEYGMDRYALDVYEPEDDEGWMDALASAFSLSDQASEAWHFIIYQLLSGMWYVYRTVAAAIIFVVDQVFTFDLVGSVSSYVGTLISEVGGEYGLGQFVNLMVMFTTLWLVYQLAFRRFRLTIAGLISAALISAGFSLYVSNADTLIDTANDYRNLAANALLTTTTFTVDDEVSAEDAAQMEPDEDEAITRDSYTEEFTAEYGMSRVGNLLHDLFVVKPYMLLQFGTTDLAVIGGGDADASGEELDNAVTAGENQIRSILDEEPGSDEREEVVQDAAANNAEIYGPEDTWERLGNAFLVWLPLLLISPFMAFVAVMVQVYNVGFLVVAATGVLILILAIFPAFRNFAIQWGFKLLYFLLMTVAMIFAAVFMFAMIMIIYRVGGEEQWGYFTMVVTIAICMAAMVVLQRQIWGYKYMQNMARHPVQSARNSANMQLQEYRQQKQAQQSMDRGSNPTGLSPAPTQQGGTQSHGGQNLRLMQASMQRKSQQDPSPIKSKARKNQEETKPEGSSKANSKREDTGMTKEKAAMQRKSRDNVAPITQKHRDQQTQKQQKQSSAAPEARAGSKRSQKDRSSASPASNDQTPVQRELEEMRRKSKDPNGVVKGQPPPPKAKDHQPKADQKDRSSSASTGAKKARKEQERMRKKNAKGPKKGE